MSVSVNFSRRGLLTAAGAASVAAVLAACADTGADGQAIDSSADAVDYDTVINSGPVAADDVVAASTWASAIKNAGVLSTGGTKTSEVFSLEDPATGKVSGFDAALAQALARYIIGGDDARSLLEVTQVTSDTRETMLENGQVDAVFATYTITPERAEKIAFAGPYYSSGQSVLVRADETGINGVDDLAGVKVAVQSNSSSGPALDEAAPEAEQAQFQDHSSCVAALEAGQVDAYVVDQSLELSEVQSNDAVKIVGEPFTEDPYGIGLPKDSDAQEFVNTFLQTIYDDGTWNAIWTATIGAIIGGEAPEPPVIGSVPGSETAAATASATD
ncbi:glutamate transport system substrate-binding protein [Actinomyces ruminicola]|uniref:Glutamate transport system substrate-binding protein n=1 Tax=Actinomyces ruminicola TaxID=332524 RepID=A0A1G9Z8R9_9ACTO|nr:glutamate ABC transporter substrate-binding protein [Actinomyces ruminicola]SDN16986.1 glutamate transport system substrate-binding protein [Actinomyces ruminicola]